MVTVNKARDFAERVIWTFIQAFLGFMVAQELTGSIIWSEVLYGALVAGGVAAAKVIIAQNVGETNAGDLLPGAPVIQGPTKPA